MSSIIFMGTPPIAVPALRALHERFGVRAVVTVPDKPVGRGLQLTPSAVKTAAIELGITEILQPPSLKDPTFIEQLRALQPDVICVIAFRILPREVYSLARLGAFNVHGSLLPRYRGAAPIQHAVMNGDTRTGVTSFLLNDVVDTGTILEQRELPIGDDMTSGDLFVAMAPLAAECAVSTTEALLAGTARPMPQDDALATPAPKLFRDDSAIDWMQNRERVRNFIRGRSPAPCAWTTFEGVTMKISRASRTDEPCAPGRWRMTSTSLIAGCGDAALSLDELQLPGKRRMVVADFLAGWRGPREGAFA